MSQFFTSSYDSSRNYIILSAVMNVDTLSKIDGLIHSNKTENLEKSQKIELAVNRSVGEKKSALSKYPTTGGIGNQCYHCS